MANLMKAVKSSLSSSKHQKLGENWTDNKEALLDGLVFHLRYLGSMLVEELTEEGQSYGDKISANVIDTIVAMQKASGKKAPDVQLTVSPRGIICTDKNTKEILHSASIYRICFCTADRNHSKVFGFITRNTENETMECYAYHCGKRKVAHAVCLSVNQSFKVCEADEREQKWNKSGASTSTDNTATLSTRNFQSSVSSSSGSSESSSNEDSPQFTNYIRDPPTVDQMLLL